MNAELSEQPIPTIKDNKFVEYIRDILPIELELKNPVPAGKVAELVFISELQGETAFSMELFPSMRDRAELCIPYQVSRNNSGKREHALDVIELCFLMHYKKEHNDESNAERIQKLSLEPMSDIENNITSLSFWNG